MSKLGYRWFPKDWSSDERVFELELSERGLFRELIDLAMSNDNKTEININSWCRRFNADVDTLNGILSRLIQLELIVFKGNKMFVPSCEKRLVLIRAGSKGGKRSVKPTRKPNGNQKENKSKKEIEIYREFKHLSLSLTDFKKLNVKYSVSQIDDVLDKIENYKNNKNYTSLYLTANNWLKKETPQKEQDEEIKLNATNNN